MIIYSHKCGQLGNRLFAFAHLIANAAANNYKLINLSFDEYAKYFQTTANDIWCRYPARHSLIKLDCIRSYLFLVNRAVLKGLRIIGFHNSAFHSIQIADQPEYKFENKKYYELNGGFKDIASRKIIVFMFGRFFRDFSNFEKYQDTVRDFFAPTPSILKIISDYEAEMKKDVDIVIGVHIRRGDYVQFAGGKYFFNYSQYYELMRNIRDDVSKKRVKFLICSNDHIDTNLFKGLDVIAGPRHLVADLYLLSRCDFIFGPPSTYSLWASFYGRKPLYHVRDPNKPLSLDHFTLFEPRELFDFTIL